MEAIRVRLQAASGPRLRTALVYLVLPFFLAGAGLLGQPLPLASAFFISAGNGLEALLIAGGALVGNLLFWGTAAGLEQFAVLFLSVTTLVLFQRTSLWKLPWFPAVLLCSLQAVWGFLFLLLGGFPSESVLPYLLRVLLAPAAAMVFPAALRGETNAIGFTTVCVLLAAASVQIPKLFNLGVLLAVVLVLWDMPAALTAAALWGLTLDLTGATLPVSMTWILCLTALLLTRKLPMLFACCLPVVSALAVMVLARQFRTDILCSSALGALCFPVLRGLVPSRAAAPVKTSDDPRFLSAACTFSQLDRLLSQNAIPLTAPEPSEIFDKVTTEACRGCPQWAACWDRQAADTFRLLSQATPAIYTRGRCIPTDFDPTFWEQCCRKERFSAAVDQAVDALRYRQQCRSRMREGCTIAAQQFRFMSQLLKSWSKTPPTAHVPAVTFQPEVGIRSWSRLGAALSGDRISSFSTPDGRFFVLLCDGMGTGPEAAGESAKAAETLQGLIQSGADPKQAMELLNGVYLLREDGVFSTIDLACIHLGTGDACLYKWGAAPSFLQRGCLVKKIGTAIPPPGFGIGSECHPDTYRLSLQRGETLVLVSDGIGEEETRQRLADLTDMPAQTVAQCLVGCTQDDADDRTAAVLRLHYLPS